MRNFTIKIFVGELISERENWENDAYRKSNDQLIVALTISIVFPVFALRDQFANEDFNCEVTHILVSLCLRLSICSGAVSACC